MLYGRGERETAIATYMQNALTLAVDNTEWGKTFYKQPQRKLLKEGE